MKKKYIIDLNPDCVEGEYLRIPARIAGEEQWLVTKAALTPYTEPDLEQVNREKDALYDEARARGYEEGKARGYQEGLFDAWEAARKIIRMPEGDLLNIFTECYSAVCTALQVFLKYDASECIEKIQAYEQEEIKVGDEVELKCGVRPAIYMQGTKGSDEIYLLFNDGSCGLHSKSEIVRKTGRHFPEIVAVLEKMRGETNE